jgi:large subunit ribosomal protein L9
MKIILRQNIENLGKIGELVTVKDGYARNYLIPRSYAYYASEKAIKALEVEKKKYAKRIAKEKADAEIIAAKLSELQISIPMKVGEEGKLYGSVTSQMIAQELSIRGFEIDKRNIVIDESIKNLGVFDIKVRLHQEVITPLKIWVISEE